LLHGDTSTHFTAFGLAALSLIMVSLMTPLCSAYCLGRGFARSLPKITFPTRVAKFRLGKSFPTVTSYKG
jgi:hypothetical protein